MKPVLNASINTTSKKEKFCNFQNFCLPFKTTYNEEMARGKGGCIFIVFFTRIKCLLKDLTLCSDAARRAGWGGKYALLIHRGCGPLRADSAGKLPRAGLGGGAGPQPGRAPGPPRTSASGRDEGRSARPRRPAVPSPLVQSPRAAPGAAAGQPWVVAGTCQSPALGVRQGQQPPSLEARRGVRSPPRRRRRLRARGGAQGARGAARRRRREEEEAAA